MNLKILVFYIYIISFIVHIISGFFEYYDIYPENLLIIIMFLMVGHLSGLVTSLLNQHFNFISLPPAYPENNPWIYISLDLFGLIILIYTIIIIHQTKQFTVTKMLRIIFIITGLLINALCFYKNYLYL